MGFLKRSLISICRQPVKSGIFFLLIVILSMLSAGSIFVRQAIINTDQNLRNLMPAVSTIVQDAEVVNEEVAFAVLSPDVIREVGALPQVRTFDYAIDMRWGVSAEGLNPWDNPDFMASPMSWDYSEEMGVHLMVEGVSNPEFLEIREGFLNLVSGRGFDESELIAEAMANPAVIATGLAQANGLEVGDIFDVQVIVSDYLELADGSRTIDHDAPPLFIENFSLEVVGIFDPLFPILPDDATFDEAFQLDRVQYRMHHRIFVPNVLAEKMFNVRMQGEMEPDEIFFQNFFILNDLLEFAEFSQAVQNLPGDWLAADFSSGFRDISAAMVNVADVADLIFLVATGATLILTALLVLLFLHDRKHEIGIYLALGENKRKIISQMILELVPLAVLGMTLALFAGNVFANELSQTMLQQNLIQEQSAFLDLEAQHQLESFGYRFELSHEEMLANYEISLERKSIALFYAFGLGVVLVATVVPIVFTVQKNPKRLLI